MTVAVRLSQTIQETDVSGEIGGDISVPPPVSGFQ